MMKLVALSAMLALMSAPVSAQMKYPTGDAPPEGGGYYALQSSYVGGPNTLPYGQGNAAAVLEHARGLSAVSRLSSTMLTRGYVRRPDADGSFTKDGYSVVVIGFEKPGMDISSQSQPAIFVITKSFEIPNIGYRPATQVFSGLLYDSSSVIRGTSTPIDSALYVEGSLSGPFLPEAAAIDSALGGAGLGTTRNDEDFVFRYSAYEPGAGQAWNWREHTSPGMQRLWDVWFTQVSAWTIGGAIAGSAAFTGGPAAGFLGVGLGAAGAFYAANASYWANPPDTSGVHH